MPLVLDDFSQAPLTDAGAWTVFSDGVMGGMSSGRAELGEVQGRRALRLRGTVSLEQRGGFLQMARHLSSEHDVECNASAFRGLSLSLSGAPGTYFVHLRTPDTRAPWQHYSAPLAVSAGWADVEVPWDAFVPTSLRAPLDTSRLLRLGIVAGRTAFDADIAVARVAFV